VVEKQKLIFGWSVNSPKVCHVIYYGDLSFLIISSLESLFNHIFWGGGEDTRKISWIDWDTICLNKEFGGWETKE